jgi:hypothetical protein
LSFIAITSDLRTGFVGSFKLAAAFLLAFVAVFQAYTFVLRSTVDGARPLLNGESSEKSDGNSSPN